MNMFIEATEGKRLKEARKELEVMTPAPMNTMLNKQPKSEATAAWESRRSMVVQEVPRTITGISLLVIIYIYTYIYMYITTSYLTQPGKDGC